MISSLEEVVKRLVELYSPDRIILFGSRAEGNEREGSDFDLLIIKETDKPPVERQIEVEKILSDRLIPLDLFVYTPQEVRSLLSIGSPFIEEVMRKGKVIYMREITQAWLRDSQDDLESAIILLEHGKFKGACYHSQQCVEKCLKALILESGKIPERTHDIIELLGRVKSLGWDMELEMDDAAFLNSIYRGRYPTEKGLLPHGEPSGREAGRAVRIAREIMERTIELCPKEAKGD
ncbi:HEPN domain-containing protein [Candidatus Poribacteria bacterium]|nr:HEPN domain-containing protein [Candidatus Poribacteria bacterium]